VVVPLLDDHRGERLPPLRPAAGTDDRCQTPIWELAATAAIPLHRQVRLVSDLDP
jgi:hypothetical protein